jgi:hypothetical protein
MDISTSKDVSAREDEGTVVHVANEAGEKQYYGEKNDKPVTITVAGTYSSRYRRASEAIRDKNMKRSKRPDGQDVDANALEVQAACMIAWEGFENAGQPFPLTKQNAIAVLDQCPWIREQVDAAMFDHAAFFKQS